ncbi:MAG: UvrB/UvrC motif-containing protein [candidate division WOR-3 bacterium]
MKCDLCGNNEAKFKYYEVDSDKVREMNICEGCAREKGIESKIEEEPIGEKNKVCGNCGLSFEEYNETKTLGCPDCYKTFNKWIKISLKKIQKDVVHRGKEAIRNSRIMDVKREIQELKRKLESFVESERFEEALKLRDEIEKRKKELKAIRGKGD